MRANSRWRTTSSSSPSTVWWLPAPTSTSVGSTRRSAPCSGRTEQELLSQPWDHWIHPDDLRATDDQNQRLSSGQPTSNPFANRYLHAGGGWRWLDWAIFPDAAHNLIYGTVRDVTEARRTAEIEALHRDALEHLARRAPLRSILANLVRSAEILVPEATGSILLVREGLLHTGAAPNLPSAFLEAIEGMPIGPEAGTCGTAAWRDAVVITTDIQHDPRWHVWHDLAASHGLVACWSVPFHTADGAVAGTVAIYPDTTRAPTAAQLATVEAIARLASWRWSTVASTRSCGCCRRRSRTSTTW